MAAYLGGCHLVRAIPTADACAMRYQGKIVEWNDARGFGFALPNGGGVRAFVHVSALQGRQRRPGLGDGVVYEVQTDAQGRLNAINVALVGATHAARPSAPWSAHRGSRHGTGRGGLWKGALLVTIIIALTTQSRVRDRVSGLLEPVLPERAVPAPSAPLRLEAPQPQFSCQGKTRCPQMRSCDEAMLYVQHCPGTQMDGDGDGIPCESQWCGD